MGTVVGWDMRDPWCVGYLLLAALLGGAIAGQSTALLATGCVLVAIALGVLRPATSAVWAGALGVLVLTATVAGGLTGERVVESVALASSAALAHAAAVALPVGLVTLARHRRENRRRGWELARALAAEEAARAESALVRERAAMAGEIHDHLGHQLTLLTVQVGQLTLDGDVPPRIQDALGQVRRGLAVAAAELGDTVKLLQAGGMPVREPADRSPSAVVRQARAAGVPVVGEVPPGFDDLSPHGRSAVVRVLSEGLANAARHAPGRTVWLDGDVVGGVATLSLRNASGDAGTSLTGSSGHGLRSLRHRLALLDGHLGVEEGAEFLLRVSVPVDAVLGPEHGPDDAVQEVVRAQRAADAEARRARRLAWLVPSALALGAVLLTVGFYLYLVVASALPPAEFARIQVGMTQSQAESILPAVEMVEAPRSVLPEPAGATCRYHEESVSLFAREDVFRICFAHGVVVSTDTIPASGGQP